MYMHVCAPPGLLGVVQTALGMGSPLCSFLIMVQQRTAELYIGVWGCIAIAVTSFGSIILNTLLVYDPTRKASAQ